MNIDVDFVNTMLKAASIGCKVIATEHGLAITHRDTPYVGIDFSNGGWDVWFMVSYPATRDEPGGFDYINEHSTVSFHEAVEEMILLLVRGKIRCAANVYWDERTAEEFDKLEPLPPNILYEERNHDYVQSDLAYDADREDRMFGRR
jgi:hypothetical protein